MEKELISIDLLRAKQIKPMTHFDYLDIDNKKAHNITLCSITWNMHGLTPTERHLDILFEDYKGHDIYAIGTEECLRSILQSVFISDKTAWYNLLTKYFGKDYIIIHCQDLSAINLCIISKKKYASSFTKIDSCFVKTGVGKMVGNKGGVAISLTFMGLSMMVINCHLAAGHKKSIKRNNDFDYIHNNLIFPKKSPVLIKHDFQLIMGDLNYRIERPIEFIEEKIIAVDYKALIDHDQLKIERNANRLNTLQYKEGQINFAPTYMYIDNTSTLNFTDAKHTPGWTDRIMYKKQETNSNIIFDLKLNTYTSIPKVEMSDHKPVVALLEFDIML